MALTAGQIVNNRYRIARLLGQGGMGAVYRAWDLSLSIPVALKEMIPQPGIDRRMLEDLRKQFQQEAHVLASLSHPSLPRVTDFFAWASNAYLVMDFVDGESLHDVLVRQGRLPESQVLSWSSQLLDALEACHHRSIVHRDIKPHNVVIRSDGRAVLVDFGLVKLWDPHNPKTQRIVRGMGTVEYASPEHFGLSGYHTEPRSDIYSLGAMLYHLVTGQEPASALERWTKAKFLTQPRQLGAQIQPHVEGGILRAMALQPDERFPNVQEMRVTLLGRHTFVPQPTVERRDSPPLPANVPTRKAMPVSRDTNWVPELMTAMIMAVVGTLSLQAILFGRSLSLKHYLSLSGGALLMGAVGWFLGDSIFQALTQPALGEANIPSNRPTQRLVNFTRHLTRSLSTPQLTGLLALLVVIASLSAWLLGPWIRSVPLLWNSLPSYAIAGPLAYAATGHRRWIPFVAHALVATVGGIFLRESIGLTYSTLNLLMAALVGGLLMEGVEAILGPTLLE